jgi:competence protein ComGC
MRKHLAIAATAATIGLAGIGAGVAHAATSSSATNTDPMSSLVDAIATKFNLNKNDVQQVFDTQKAQRDADRETKIKAEVAQLVTDGKITQAQADLINEKRAELQKQRETDKTSFDSMTDTERKTAMDKKRTDLESWAKQNNIDTQYLRYAMGGGHGHGGPGGPRDGIETSKIQ